MREWPITKFWYTRKKGKTIEEIIDTDPDWLDWAIREFQNLTPSQAKYYEKKIGKKLPGKFIQDVEPYEWMSGDPDEMYLDLCHVQDLEKTIRKWRGRQLELF